ncbi:MAG TPA: hypothetical protein VF407_07000, partial [Polyangiaceae bacterium]
MRSLHLRLALISITTLSVAAALACSSSSSSDDDDDITGTDSGGGGTDATTIDATPVTDAGPADAEVPCTATPCVRQVTVGGAVSCALLDDHSIRCWGNNRSGELGSGTLDAGVVSPATMIPPVTVPGITDAIAFAATGELVGQLDTICAIVGGGGMECWGDNVYGQLGNETAGALTAIGPTPTHVLHVQSVGGGVAHVCVVTDDGGVSCWGSNYYAEVGHTNADGGNREPIPSDVPFGAAVSFTQVSGGLEHSCGV